MPLMPLPSVCDLQDPATIPIKEEEAREQSRLVAALRRCWARLSVEDRPIIFAVPNGGKRNAAEAANLKVQGALAGVSDLIILLPNARTILLEMKAGNGRLSQGQIDFEQGVLALKFPYIVAYSAEDALGKLQLLNWSI